MFFQKSGWFFWRPAEGIRKRSKLLDEIEYYSTVRSYRAIDESDISVVVIDVSKGFNIIYDLIENGYKIFFDTNKKNIKNQTKDAVKNNAKFMITINKEISVKNLISKKETNGSESEILPFFKNQ